MAKRSESKSTDERGRRSALKAGGMRTKYLSTITKSAPIDTETAIEVIPRAEEKISVGTAGINVSPAIIALAKESFRFNSTFENMMMKLDEPNRKKYRSSYPWFRRKIQDVIEEAGLQIVDLTDQKYEQGMSVTVMNMDDFDENDELFVDQMIEPIITGESGLVSSGVVLLRR